MILSQRQLEEIAASTTKDFNRFFFGDEADKPDRSALPTPIDQFAKNYLGLRVSFARLSPDGSICGVTAYADTEYKITELGITRTLALKRNQVILDESFIRSGNVQRLCAKRRFTLAHECAHQILFQLESEEVKASCEMRYSARTAYTPRELKTREDWNEWQANVLGAAILLPQKEVDLAMRRFEETPLINYEGRYSYHDHLTLRLFCRLFGVSKSAFDDLTNLITEIDKPQKATEAEESGLNAEELAAAEAALAHEKYDALFEQNNDFIGWIKIEGTNVNYPVMQTPNKPDFYLKRSFDKTYSDCGVPYIDEACMTGISNNLVIYGHHMNDGSMFADLCKYTDADFYKEHPTIAFDTLSGLGKYEVVAAFKFNTNRESFKYNEYTLMDEVQFAEFMENVRARQLYDTGVTAEYGDQLLTLSTCEYTYPNGRFVVVAKKA